MTSRILTPAQQAQVADLIKLHHAALVVELLGDRSVPPAILTQIKARGLYRKPRPDVIHRAFTFGTEGIVDERVLEMSPEEFDAYMARKGITLRPADREAMAVMQESLANYVQVLGHTYEDRMTEVVAKANRTLQGRLQLKQRQELFLELERRKALAALAKDMTDITRMQLAAAHRVVHTETNNAYQAGRANEILRKSGEDDPLVYKQPRPDACWECKEAYLEGDSDRPKVFRLSELLANGSNVGKSRGERLAVLEAFHPWCFPAGALITTARGNVPIEDVIVGDRVWTHKNRWRPVVQLHRNHFAGGLCNVNGAVSTGSHPFLTLRGWIPAAGLQSGDYVFCQDVDVPRICADNGPSMLLQEAGFYSIFFPFALAGMPGAVNFDGNAIFDIAEIDVVATDSQLRDEWNRLRAQHRKESFFEIRHHTAFLAQSRTFFQLLHGALASTPSSLSRSNAFSAFIRRHLGVHIMHCLARRSPYEAVVGHVPQDGSAVHAQNTRHFQHGSALSVVQFIKALFRDVLALRHSDPGCGVPRMYKVDTSRIYHRGPVYNLSVLGDESYVANGLIVHNCACELHWLPPGFGFAADGTLEYQQRAS